MRYTQSWRHGPPFHLLRLFRHVFLSAVGHDGVRWVNFGVLLVLLAEEG